MIFKGENILGAPSSRLREIRGDEIAMIFQDPMTSLNPVHSIGRQLMEAVLLHNKVGRKEAKVRALDLLKAVGIPRAERRIDDYPHQFSGGMRQRVMIAMALINSPDLLIADEPTTALDVTTQAQILALLKRLQDEFGTAIVMITHDLGVVAEIADDVVVMYAAKVVEEGTGPRHLRTAAAPVHLGPDGLDAAPRRQHRQAHSDPRSAAVAPASADGLPVQSALRAHDGGLHDRPAGAPARPRCRGSRRRLSPRRGDEGA